MGTKSWRSSLLLAVAVTWTLLILVACWLPTRRLPVPESQISRFRIPNLDKIVHFTLFAGFGLWWMLVEGCRNRPIAVFAAGVALAILSELGQKLEIVGRDATTMDALADIVGACAGIALVMGVRRLRARPAPSG